MSADLSRREVLKLMAGATVAAALPLNLVAAPQTLITRPIPKSGEKLPIVGLGTSGPFRSRAGANLDNLKEVLRLFAENGGKLVDTAPSYGEAEDIIGDLVAQLGIRDKLFIATKVDGRVGPAEQFEASQKQLRTQKMELVQVHNLRNMEAAMAKLRELKKAGTIKYIGATTSNTSAFPEMEKAMREHRDLDFIQINFSLAEPEAEKTLLPLAQELKLATLINRPFTRARMFDKVEGKPLPDWAKEFGAETWGQFFLKWILGHPGVTVAIPATGNPKHVVENLHAGAGKLPDAAMRKRMADYFATL